MPIVPHVSYPGVYVQEVESNVHTIVPVDTATTAFIGRAMRGPVNEPTVINSFADFQRIFGGLWHGSSLGFAVSQFYQNGGSKAIIVRLYPGWEPDNPDVGKAKVNLGGSPKEADTNESKPKGKPAAPSGNGKGQPVLYLKAKSPGAWSNKLCVRVTYPDQNIEKQLAKKYAITDEDVHNLFNLAIYDSGTGVTEQFNDLTLGAVPESRQFDKVLAKESQLVDGILEGKDLPIKRPDESPAPQGAKGVWDDPKAYIAPTTDKGSDGEAWGEGTLPGDEARKTGIYALENTDIFNLLYISPDLLPGNAADTVLPAAAAYCEKRRAFLLIDPPASWTDKNEAKKNWPLPGLSSHNAAIYFPKIKVANPLRDNQVEEFGPGAVIAGVFARTDATRGVWKAPAGLEATLKGVVGLSASLTDGENGELNPLGINCLRQMPAAGYVIWGARTIVGDDRLVSQWKYVPVRRTALYIEESLYRGTQWAVFEPNDEPLWSQIRLNIGVFMHGLFRQGAFQGQSPQEAYFVKCDSSTTTQADIDRGIVNIIVGFAPLKPAEFVILYIQQTAGQLTT